MPAPITRTLGRFASELTYEALPRTAVEAIVTGFIDAIAVMYPGLDMPVTRQVRSILGTRGQNPEARLYLGNERASAPEAAFATAAAISGSVFDDVAFAGCHTSAILVPALLAEGEALGASGRDVIRAYAAGYEMWARLSERDKDSYSSKGWHATAVFGPVAAAAAVANLRRLDPAQTTTAIGIAAAMSGGITASFDHDAGPFQVGRASSAGILAARLAGNGMTAAADALERPGRGLLVALSPQGRIDLDTPIEDLGSAWRLESVGIHLKQYPFGNMCQRALDGLLDLVRTHDIKPDDVTRIDALISVAQMEVHSKSPSTINFVPSHSIALALTAALLDRRVTFDHLGEAFVGRRDVQEIMKRVRIEPDAAIPADTTPNLGFSGGIRLHLADGRVLESPSVAFARGHWTRRLSPEELWIKFSGCAAGDLSPSAMRTLFDALQGLDRVAAVRDLNRAA